MATGFNGLNDVSVTGLVNIDADTLACGIIIASEIIVDGINIVQLLDDLENQIDNNAAAIAQLQADMLTKGGLSTNNTWTGQNLFTNQTTLNGQFIVNSNNVTFNNATSCVFTASTVKCSIAPTASNDLTNKAYVDSVIVNPEFVPKFYNYSVEIPGSVAFTQGLRVDFSGNWTEKDYFMLRVRAQLNYALTPWPGIGLNEWQQYATASAELIVRPYYAPAGTYGTSSPFYYWPTNNGTLFGNVQKFMYSTADILNGTNLFIVAGTTTTTGLNATGFFNLRGLNPSLNMQNPFRYTCAVEYISIAQDTPGAGHVTFTATPQYGGINQYLS